MADGQTETVIVGGTHEVVGRKGADGNWQVSVNDGETKQKALPSVVEAFDKLMIAQSAASLAGNDWGVRLGELIHYAQLAGFALANIEPEAIDEKMLKHMAENPGLKPYVENVQKAMAMKQQFETMEAKCFDRLETAVENQLSGRAVASSTDARDERAQLSIPNLKDMSVQRG